MAQHPDPFDSLPPLAKAKAESLAKPYRPSRMPWVMAAVITAVLHLIFFSVKWANGPTEAHVQDLMKPDPRRPVVVYQNLRAPVAPPVARQISPQTNEPAPDAAKPN